ncbi:hypothetical protein [Spongiivirga citrea]|uniref:Uncharacterized protein n=1 Tax=Spongiivirga citrea TaxID=1481457 RepID=A0A6M0CP65_9FLAO|nr:hypothetical protein [Spongiivirga citrea]NER17659.1 hypothetical protein [Spongiivirga citrea]
MRKVALFILLIIAGVIIIGSGKPTSTGEITFQDVLEVIELKKNGQDSTQKVFYFTQEEVVTLGFNAKKYLPKNFDPFLIEKDSEVKKEVNIEEEEVIEFNFSTEDYLHQGFDQHAAVIP